jgi:hypothetical protein
MKRRLSDHDDDAIHRLTAFCGRHDDPRPSLAYVHVRNGWAWATDTYRAAFLPVDLNLGTRTYAIPVHEAYAGGSVSLTPPVGGETGAADWDLVCTLPGRPLGWLSVPEPSRVVAQLRPKKRIDPENIGLLATRHTITHHNGVICAPNGAAHVQSEGHAWRP